MNQENGATYVALGRWVDITLLSSFIISGVSALIYQVCWQRGLYSVVGVDMDSVTIVVSAFMLGIGIGGMSGGWLADRFPTQRIRAFAVAELSIALYGASSIWILPWLDSQLAASVWGGAAMRGLLSFLFLVVPTTTMGMTLPLLTMAMNERRANIGISVGVLYFANTLGAAAGAGLVPFVLFQHLSLPQTIMLAVAGNVVVAGGASWVAGRLASYTARNA